jgi:hypothetical protein
LEDVIIGINDTDITDFTFTQVRFVCVCGRKVLPSCLISVCVGGGKAGLACGLACLFFLVVRPYCVDTSFNVCSYARVVFCGRVVLHRTGTTVCVCVYPFGAAETHLKKKGDFTHESDSVGQRCEAADSSTGTENP